MIALLIGLEGTAYIRTVPVPIPPYVKIVTVSTEGTAIRVFYRSGIYYGNGHPIYEERAE